MGRLIRWLIVFPLLGLLLYVGHPFLLRAMGRYLITEDRLQKAGVIAVLAGDGGVARTLEAVRLYQDGYAPRIVLTHQLLPPGYEALARLGITVPEERDIQWMVLKAMRIPTTVVLQVDERADSTESEMVYLTRFLKKHRIETVILVTNRSHSTRASKILARASGGKITIISRPTRYDTFDPEGWWHSRADAKEVLSEYEKLLNYLVQPVSAGLTGWLKGGSDSSVPVEATF
ncbi:YdcF family protein [Candidatus Methylomirabilis sp.]|uniref:YdcF family protein n=1 Tax=Candidatus Methylomirabilis sp. TaxID=2032687 RepID=UPI002A623DE2|nr:YdcF family protein [Candidatus Methylomirabilis sp.]